MLRGGLGRPRRVSSLFFFCCLSGLRATSTRPWRPVRFERDGQAGRAGGRDRDGHALVAVGLKLSIWPTSPVAHDVLPAVKRSLFLNSARATVSGSQVQQGPATRSSSVGA